MLSGDLRELAAADDETLRRHFHRLMPHSSTVPHSHYFEFTRKLCEELYDRHASPTKAREIEFTYETLVELKNQYLSLRQELRQLLDTYGVASNPFVQDKWLLERSRRLFHRATVDGPNIRAAKPR